MKLSEAIRNGCSYKPQTFGRLADDDGVCALGAALCGIGKYPEKMNDGTWNWSRMFIHGTQLWAELWPYVNEFPNKCFVCNYERDRAYYPTVWIISHLNDTHKMSREAIAEYVETLENEIAKKDEKTEIPSAEVVNGKPVLVG